MFAVNGFRGRGISSSSLYKIPIENTRKWLSQLFVESHFLFYINNLLESRRPIRLVIITERIN